MYQVMTKKQQAALRRMLHIVGQELVAMAASEKLPDQWDENEGYTSYTVDAKNTVYFAMRKDGIVP